MVAKPIRENLADMIDPAHAALVVIDVQNDFYTPHYDAMIARLQRLLVVARDTGLLVIYVQNSVLPELEEVNSPSEISRRERPIGPSARYHATAGKQRRANRCRDCAPTRRDIGSQTSSERLCGN